MSKFVLHTSPTAQWHALVSEAEAAARCELNEDTASYLVFMLMRFVTRPKSIKNCLALGYLHGLLQRGRLRRQNLRDVGDQCLLYAGLFPDHAHHSSLSMSYYVRLGRSAYHALSSDREDDIFNQLSHRFIDLMDVLLNMRELDDGRRSLDPLQAHELWLQTGSRHALRIIKESTGAIPPAQLPQIVH
jgi:hypothetical protein